MLSSIRAPFVKDILTWVAPAVAIPGLRYFQDTEEDRDRLFVRDASTYVFGALLFLGVQGAMRALLRKSAWPLAETARDMLAFVMALTVNILYAGIGAVQLSRRFTPPSPRLAAGPDAPFLKANWMLSTPPDAAFSVYA